MRLFFLLVGVLFSYNTISAQIYVDGTSYGGTPNNSSDDDTGAFNAALAAASGRTITFKKGTYNLNAEIRISNVRIVGDSAKCKPKTTAKPVFMIVSNGSLGKNISFSNINIEGDSTKANDGIFIKDTLNGIGCDFISLNKVAITLCRYGINVQTRSIWNKFYDCQINKNKGGLKLLTSGACNLWDITACTFNDNDTFGVYMKNLNADVAGFKNFRFQSCNFEANGTDTLIRRSVYGGYFDGMEMLNLENVYCEGNGNNKNDSSYGIKITGGLGRLFTIANCWVVDSKYPVYIDGAKKSGLISNCFLQKAAYVSSGEDLFLKSAWVNDEPKVIIQNCIGKVRNDLDINANMPTFGIDWDGVGSSTISMRNRNWLKIYANTADVRITSINDIIPGIEFGIINYTNSNKSVIIDSSLTFNNVDIIITANKSVRLIVDGYPTTGKIRVVAYY